VCGGSVQTRGHAADHRLRSKQTETTGSPHGGAATEVRQPAGSIGNANECAGAFCHYALYSAERRLHDSFWQCCRTEANKRDS